MLLVRKYDDVGGIDSEHGHAWRQAGWINDRIQACGDYNPDQAITEDITKNDQEIARSFIHSMNKNTTTDFVDLKTQAYKARNKREQKQRHSGW